MGDGWGGVRDKSQRGLGPWEPLLLWSVKSTGSQWSTWPLQRAYSSKSACEGDDKTPSADLQGHVCSSSGRFWQFGLLSELKSIQSAWGYEINESRCSINGENFSQNASGWLSCDYRLCPKSLTRHHMAHYIMCLPYSSAFLCVQREFFLKL